LYMSEVRLRKDRGGTGALAAFLAGAAESIGQSHHLVWSLFPDRDGKRDFVYRMIGTGPSEPILLYSPEPVVDAHGLWEVRTRPFTLADNLMVGDQLSWSIRVNAVVHSGGKKHDLVTHARVGGDDAHRDDIAGRVIPPWLETKLAAAGLDAPASDMIVQAQVSRSFRRDPRGRGAPVKIGTTDLRGRGTVCNPEALAGALREGIGKGKAYGCGMLLINRIP